MDNKEFGKFYNLTSECLLDIINPLAGIEKEKIREIANELSFKNIPANKAAGEVLFAVLRSYNKLQQAVNKYGVEDKVLEDDNIPDFIRKRLENIE